MVVAPADGDANSLGGIYWLLSTMGTHRSAGIRPTDTPDVAGAWAVSGRHATTLERARRRIRRMVDRRDDEPHPSPRCFRRRRPATIGALVDSLATRLLGTKLTGTQRSAVIGFCTRSGRTVTENSSSANAIRYDLARSSP